MGAEYVRGDRLKWQWGKRKALEVIYMKQTGDPDEHFVRIALIAGDVQYIVDDTELRRSNPFDLDDVM